MLRPFIKRARSRPGNRFRNPSNESGITLALVTVALFTILGMAALSIDIGTLYQAKAEAQRAADAAALSAARVISLSGITADPTSGPGDGSWNDICGANGTATQTAILMAQQSTIGGQAVAASGVTVTYGAGPSGGANSSCTGAGTDFAINPIVNVTVQRTNLPIFFARVFSLLPNVNYSGSSVSATASAEGYNPSDSGHGSNVGTPVQPRCVKPWIIPNTQTGSSPPRFVHRTSGASFGPGVQPYEPSAYVGQSFSLQADCGSGPGCVPARNPPTWSLGPYPATGSIDYVPANVTGTPLAVPLCSAYTGYSASNTYQTAISGCDQSTVYACGYPGGSAQGITEANLGEYPGGGIGDTAAATECLINQTGAVNAQDQLVISPFPYQIQAGSSNPLVTAGITQKVPVVAGDNITSSTSIVTIPIAEFNGNKLPTTGVGTASVSIVGFLQAFVNNVDTTSGNVNITILNVAGCGYAASGTPVYGTSPVPIRLITPP